MPGGRGKTSTKSAGVGSLLDVRKRQKTSSAKGKSLSHDDSTTNLVKSSARKTASTDSITELKVRKSSDNIPEASAAVKPRVSESPQQKLRHLEALRQFDLDYTFGPCAGVTRMQRWNKAQKLGLEPPASVKQMVEEHLDDPDYVHGLWYTTSI